MAGNFEHGANGGAALTSAQRLPSVRRRRRQQKRVELKRRSFSSGKIVLYPRRPAWSPIAQLVEHSTVNRMVAGSSPARGAKLNQRFRRVSEDYFEGNAL